MDHKKDQDDVLFQKNVSKKQRNSLKISLLASEDVSEKTPEVPLRRKTPSKCSHEEEARLERAVFGNASDVIQKLLGKDALESTNREKSLNTAEKIDDIDSHSYFHSSDSDDHEENLNCDISDSGKKEGKAWTDDDCDEYLVSHALNAQNRKLNWDQPDEKYTDFLQNKFSQVFGTPKWAKQNVEDVDSDGSDSEVFKHSNYKVAPKVGKLAKGIIDLKVLKDINQKTHNEGPHVTSVQFHPTSTVALVAGSSGVLSLFEVDGRENNKIHCAKFKKFPISTARFLKEGTQIILGSLSDAHCFTYDLMSGSTLKTVLPHGITNMQRIEVSPNGKYVVICGRLGEIYVLSSVTKELITTFKMNGKCNALTFTPDSEKLITHGECTELYVWDMRNRTCMHRAVDDGCLSAASIAISPSGQFIATGSKQGVVNIYDSATVLQNKCPTPLKIVLNLVTSITNLKFNPSSEILAIASSKKTNAFKLLHIPSFTVFSNFPTSQTKMYNPLAIDFSPGSGYMSLTNNKGFAYLYRLKHYGNY